MELTIQGAVYQFSFGIGFLHEINKTVTANIDGTNGTKRNMGLSYAVASLLDGDVEKLVEVLDLANKNQNPRLMRSAIESYIEDENTDIDDLFKQVLDFLAQSNATKKMTKRLIEEVEKRQDQI